MDYFYFERGQFWYSKDATSQKTQPWSDKENIWKRLGLQWHWNRFKETKNTPNCCQIWSEEAQIAALLLLE